MVLMNKILFSLTILSLGWFTLWGQTERSNLLIGGNGGLNLNKLDGQDKFNFNLNISPKVGLFVLDNLAIGAQAVGVVQKFGGVDGLQSQLFVGPFARYYFHNLFIEANFGINRGDFDVGFGLGYAFFVTPNVAIEPIANLNVLNGIDLNILAGFQLYFSPGELGSAF